jgi:hypothetical protein
MRNPTDSLLLALGEPLAMTFRVLGQRPFPTTEVRLEKGKGKGGLSNNGDAHLGKPFHSRGAPLGYGIQGTHRLGVPVSNQGRYGD